MINQFILVGFIKKMPVDNCLLELEVKRNYKNTDGVFEKDLFNCHLWIAIAKKIMITCKEGDLVAIKGRLVGTNNKCDILAEQVVLLNKRL